MTNRLPEKLGNLRAIQASASSMLDRAGKTAGRLSLQPSEVLSGILSFGVFVAGGLVLSLVLPPVLAVAAPAVLGAIGMPTGILIARGGASLRLEREARQRAILLRSQSEEGTARLRRIKELKNVAPPRVIDALWNDYLQRELSAPPAPSLAIDHQKQLLLPPPGLTPETSSAASGAPVDVVEPAPRPTRRARQRSDQPPSER